MPSITGWTRLEPRARAEDLSQGLEARIHDPLWMLCRQWQMGELAGEDCGTPAAVKIEGACGLVDEVFLGNQTSGEGNRFDPTKSPLDPIIQREQLMADTKDELWFSIQAGLHFLSLLEFHQVALYRQDFIKHYGLRPPISEQTASLDDESRRYWSFMEGRVPDGFRLYALFRSNSKKGNATLPESFAVSQAHRANLLKACEEWLDWYEALWSHEESDAWTTDRMEHQFAIAAPTASGQALLTASQYDGARLDWYTFDLDSVRLPKGSPRSFAVETIPTPVTYPGMPSPRWWEFEDSQTDFASVETGPDDLARMLVTEFALNYGNDWFLIPIKAPIGSLIEIKSLMVLNTFGERISIPSAAKVDGAKSDWRMFSLSSKESSTLATTALFLPPCLDRKLEGPLMEEIGLVRDEISNLVWGIELQIQNALGQSIKCSGALAAKTSGSASASPQLRYKLMSEIPDAWIPFVSEQVDGALRWKKKSLIKSSTDGTITKTTASGRLLSGASDVLIHDEEIPTTGVSISRTYQMARWSDGSTHMWIGRRKRAGQSAPSSGLRFDFVE